MKLKSNTDYFILGFVCGAMILVLLLNLLIL